jgi:hypothetical protein
VAYPHTDTATQFAYRPVGRYGKRKAAMPSGIRGFFDVMSALQKTKRHLHLNHPE